ncbi:MAG: MtrB/PioB family decaheme-associated outer membrane protein [Gammaproteobacteria bacterium]|nr:MtrB/PioB family decaheme-associated outer membrane protein [Gammaproteobacteria bacterium]MDH3750659.1 MtrB/PioB family decaheme-associated outer membrane protein [Gammaproteobacteria bacterium]
MMKRNLIYTLVIGAAALAGTAHAQAVDTSGWACEFCPFEDGHRADYEIGATSVDGDSAYFGDATGYDEDGAYANVDGNGSYAKDGYRLRWTAEDLGLDSRAIELKTGRPGSYDINLGYRELPRRQFNTTATIFEQNAGDALALPSSWVPAGLTSGMTQLDSSLVARNIESDRSVFDLGARFVASDHWRISADYRRHERDGSRITGGSSFTQASLLPMPFDYVTDEVDLGIRYGADNGFVTLGWYLSDFSNDNAALTWEQPYSVDPLIGNDTFSRAQAPDSQLQQVSLQAGYSFPKQKTVVSFSAAIGEIEQDSSFLPYTITSSIVTTPLPRANLDGSVDTSNFALAVTSRVIDKGRIKFSYRYDERDNKTAQDQWDRVIVDTFGSAELEANIPYSFERSTLSLSADYDLFDTVRVSAGYDRKDIDRDFQEIGEQTEDSGWGRLRWQPTPTLEMDFRGGASERDADRYDEVLAASLEQNPLMRKYHLAYRYRRFGELTLTYSPADGPISITLDSLYADDNYNQSELGITGGEELRVAADLSWAISDNASAYLTAGFEDIESEQAGSEVFAAPDWRATHDDDFTTVGLGFRVRNIADKVDIQLDYIRSDGASEIIVDSASGGPSEFPELSSELDYLRFKLTYQYSARLAMNLNLRYMRFVAEDWALEGVEPATIPTVLSLGAEPYSPDVYAIGIGFRYRIDAE